MPSTSRPILLHALLVGVLAAPTEEIPRSVDEDTTVRRTCSSSVELELQEVSATVNGEQLPEDVELELEMTISGEYEIVVLDVYGEPGDGRPRSLARTFERIAGEEGTTVSSVDGDEEETVPVGSELEDLTVEFHWNETEEEYDVELVEGEVDDELLAALREDMDLRAFLPEDEVTEGDSWSIDPAAFELVNYPGGVDTVADDEDEASAAFEELLDETLDGEIEATFQGTRDEDGTRVAAIFVTASVWTEGEWVDESEGAPVAQTMSYEMDLEGELLWDLDAGHLHSFTLAGDMELESLDEVSEEFEGEDWLFRQTMRFAGEVEYVFEVERD